MTRSSKKIPTPAAISAVLSNELTALKKVITSGDGVDALDRDGRSALFQAVIDGRNEMVRLLLAAGAQARLHDKAGWTPLHFAAQACQPTIAAILLDGGAEVDAADESGNTPLARAAFESRGRGKVIAVLLARGAAAIHAGARGELLLPPDYAARR